MACETDYNKPRAYLQDTFYLHMAGVDLLGDEMKNRLEVKCVM